MFTQKAYHYRMKKICEY